MADPVQELKKKMLTKMREAGLPKVAEEAVDLLTPDDLEDVGLTAAAAMIPGGAVAKTAEKVARKVMPVARVGMEKAASKIGHTAAMRALEESGQEAARNIGTVATGVIGSIPLMVTDASEEEFQKEFDRLKEKRAAKKERRKDMVP